MCEELEKARIIQNRNRIQNVFTELFSLSTWASTPADDAAVAGDRAACVGILCKWLSSGAMSMDKLLALLPPGIDPEDDLRSAWINIVLDAEKDLVFWYHLQIDFASGPLYDNLMTS